MGHFLNSIYFKILLAACLAILPAGSLILYQDYHRLNRLLDQQLQEHFRQVGAQFFPEDPQVDSRTRFEDQARRILDRFNASSAAIRMVQSCHYVKTTEEGVYRLAENVPIDKGASMAMLATNVFKDDDYLNMRKIDNGRYAFMVPFPSGRSPEQVVVLQALDETRAAYLQKAVLRTALFWSLTFLALLLFIAFVIHSEIKIPLKHLKTALTKKRKAALDPADFGEYADLVQIIEEIRSSQTESGADRFIDPDTGFHTELAAQKIYADLRKSTQSSTVIFFKVNFADDYVKSFGRANRAAIKKLAAEALDAGLPKSAPRAVTDDYFFISGIDSKEFKKIVERCQNHFNEAVLQLYELGQGKQVPIQTLSAIGLPNANPAPETFAAALELTQANWESATNPRRGGWALLMEDGILETSVGDRKALLRPADRPAAPSVAAPAVPPGEHLQKSSTGDIVGLSPADEPMDPAFARKMFIVKLCRLAGIKPRMAAQVYSAGWQKPDLLLQTKIQELSSRSGIEAEDASALIASLRKVPKEKLAYEPDDYREVFITDIRMIRKIPRESLAKWFDAGYRRLEDLRKATADDLITVEPTVSREDIEAVLASIRDAVKT